MRALKDAISESLQAERARLESAPPAKRVPAPDGADKKNAKGGHRLSADDEALLAGLKKKAAKLGLDVRKGELLHAGLALLDGLPGKELKTALGGAKKRA